MVSKFQAKLDVLVTSIVAFMTQSVSVCYHERDVWCLFDRSVRLMRGGSRAVAALSLSYNTGDIQQQQVSRIEVPYVWMLGVTRQ